jgi:hypothetical protein
MMSTNAQSAFTHFDFSEGGKWEWVENGSWPAIDIGDLMPKDEQPVQP